MTTIRITRHLDSDTIRIPELAPLVGKDVEITVREEGPAMSEGLRKFLDSAGKGLVDPKAVEELREISKI